MTTRRLKGSHCSGCGQVVVWGLLPDGRRIPLDQHVHTFKEKAEEGQYLRVERVVDTYANHLAVCRRTIAPPASAPRVLEQKKAGRRLYVRPFMDSPVSKTWKNEVSNRPQPHWIPFEEAQGGA